ncbi:hypothetical protein CHU95_11380 [Niveispirillum lacus]|uniref:FecR protein domain-containing protein n=1 Tax=Niveispirillum lacus TaxID=1981099 RepID=A0A255YZG7_9PROT|nr:FecR domain-containing protein [Niveispirillum lacus]OYQ34598.1 hypothetical protein CHU95_11380 [Niveispirillum lacus]
MSGDPLMLPANQDMAKGGAYWALREVEGPALSPAEEVERAAWLAADPAHPDDLRAMRDILLDDALAVAMTRYITTEPAMRQPSRRALLGGSIAAALALSIGAPLLVHREQVDGAGWVSVPQGTIQPITLADGSQVTVNGRTELFASTLMPTRHVMLARGEAFFQVATTQVGPPFDIVCGPARIQTKAGALNLDLVEGLTEISVYEGAALVTVGEQAVRLSKGERAGVTGLKLNPPTAFDPQAGDFRSGWLVTQGLSLAQLTERLNRTAPVPVHIADPAIAGRRVAGRFKLTEPDRLLASLGKLHGFTVRHRGGVLELVTV